ncbi:MAG: hypothetical protein ABSA46_17955 [Thermodesulfovibrionales bacterium]
MTKWVTKLTILVFVLALVVAVGGSNSQAAGMGRGHGFGVDQKLIASLGLTTEENTALTTALSTYGPAVKDAMKAFHAAQKQLKTDVNATPPVSGSTLVTDAGAVVSAKAALKAARGQLDSALSGALTTPHLTALQNALTAQFQSRLAAKTDHVLFGYARYLSKQ